MAINSNLPVGTIEILTKMLTQPGVGQGVIPYGLQCTFPLLPPPLKTQLSKLSMMENLAVELPQGSNSLFSG